MIGAQGECDCPACSGAELDPASLIDDLLTGGADLLTTDDPMDAEIAGAVLVSFGEFLGESFEEVLVAAIVPELEARANAQALAMLLAISSVARVEAAVAAADRLAKAGIPRPAWAAELTEPVSVAECWRLVDTDETESILVCAFERAGRSHALGMTVKHHDCGAACEIFHLDPDGLPNMLEDVLTGIRSSGLEATYTQVPAAELRWLAEQALDSRAIHESAALDLGIYQPASGDDDDDDAEYRTMAALFRVRLNVLPAPVKPANAPREYDDNCLTESTGPSPARLVDDGSDPVGAPVPAMPLGLVPMTMLPPERKESALPAPIFQVKVGLRGAKPPIWRRLEIPADISLAQLHEVIQVAFEWNGGHMHVFETDYGEFGKADAALGHSSETAVTLEQVAPAAGRRIRYTYDFGDNWKHEIVVEKTVQRDSTLRYPRCTGGRRAAPPDDCGGVWGYAELVGVLGDPAHPEHDDMLEWLGLDSAAEFEPGHFDAESITMSLSQLRC